MGTSLPDKSGRLNLGAPIDAVVSIDQIKESMDNESG